MSTGAAEFPSGTNTPRNTTDIGQDIGALKEKILPLLLGGAGLMLRSAHTSMNVKKNGLAGCLRSFLRIVLRRKSELDRSIGEMERGEVREAADSEDLMRQVFGGNSCW